jgi:UDP-N-acetylglucosamine--N-acetylmuramyl-(pentapeptide) pyrophosphoryl-undecaprenol N-acetylglucosamine transferase
MMRSPPSKQEALSFYGFTDGKPCLLVLGGSQGSQLLNDLVPSAVSLFDEKIRPSVLHLAGKKADINAISASYESLHIRARVLSYEEKMQYALQAADVVISRSGASTIAENEAFGKKSLYIPFASSLDDHQKENALIASSRSSSLLLEERFLDPMTLFIKLKMLLEFSSDNTLYEKSIERKEFVTLLMQTLNENTT